MKLTIESTNRHYHLEDGRVFSVWAGLTEEGNRVEVLVAGLMANEDDDAAEREIRGKLKLGGEVMVVAEGKAGPDEGPGTIGKRVPRSPHFGQSGHNRERH